MPAGEGVPAMRCNRKKLAAVLEKDVKTIDKMVAKGMPFVSRPGQPPGQQEWVFDTAKVARWMAGKAYIDRGNDARRRLAVAEAGLKELKLAELGGLVVRLDTVGRHVTAGDAIVKSRLLAVPSRVAQAVSLETDPDKIEALLRKEIESALEQYNKKWDERG